MVGRMARIAPTITCGPEDRQKLNQLAGSRTEPKQMVERARIILGCLAGKGVQQVARECHTRPNTVIKWRQRFVSNGLRGLYDVPRPGPKRVYDDSFRNRVLALLEEPPTFGPGKLGWAGGGGAVAGLGARGLACVAQGGHLFAAATVLVCEYGQGVRCQGGGHCGSLPQSAREGSGDQRGREAQYSGPGTKDGLCRDR